MWEKFKEPAFKLFGKVLDPYIPYFESIKTDLQHANIPLSLTEYVYTMFFLLLLIFIIEFPLIVIITTLLLKSALTAFLFSFTMTIIIELGMFFIFYTYPSYTATTRKKNIETSLSFATTYMSTIASSGAPPSTMFKVLSKFKEYGEISKEAEKINRDVEAFGMDLTSAIRKTAGRTPSSELKELLWGMDTILTTGGNMSDFLHEKSKGFMAEYKRRLEQYSQTLSMLIEVYLTVILVGSIFFVIMSALMSIFSGGGDTNLFMSFLQFVIVFIVLPVVSVGFIVMIRMISPSA